MVPGVYAAVLALESDRWVRSERAAARMRTEDGTFMRRNTGWLLERLRFGEPVVVQRVAVELALWQRDREAGRGRLPVARGVRRVRVSPDDRAVPDSDSEYLAAEGD